MPFWRESEDRGPLLLAVRIRATKWMVVLLAVVAVWLLAVALGYRKRHTLDAWFITSFPWPLLVYLLFPRIKFYQNGVMIPPTENYNRGRFLRWDQVVRYSWDEDRLVITGTTSMLSGGPVEGDRVQIPPSKQREVDQILALKVGLG
jgi:hypothetical protein